MAGPHKTVVAALVFIQQGETLLLVKQDYGLGYWSLPGGVMEAGESIDQAAMREVKEETGLEIRLGRLIGVYSMAGEGALALTFEGSVAGGELRADGEICQAEYFPMDRLPGHVREHFWQRLADFRAGDATTVMRTQ